ncbi:restriction endonuclease subunit S [Paenibacillus sp. NRS-1760]|uniref:restriction endonuclease subunit S n=1 Tax=Paenibacillus sp. NRS-1760 TaxID=3233902 RepID=UPI003D2CD93D
MSKWEKVKLGELVLVKGGKRLPKDHTYVDNNSSFPYIRVCDFNNGTVDLSDLKYISSTTSKLIKNYIITKDDVYISIAGTIGLVGTIPPEIDNAHLTENAAKLVIKKKENLSTRYLVKFLSSENGIKQIKSKTIATSQPKLALFRIEELDIPLPPLEVQKKIAQNLDTVSELLDLRKKQLEELDQLIKSVFYDMFGDPVTNDKGWEMKKFEDIGRLTSGGTPSRSKAEYFTGNINWFSAGELNDRYLYESTEKITEQAILESSAKIFPKGSMLIGMYDTAAFKLGILTQDSSSNQACANIIVNENKTNIIWVYDVCQIMKITYLSNRRGVRQKNLNLGMIKEFTLPVPPLALQNEFASIVTKIEEQKALVKQSIQETQTLFDSLISQYFD